MTQLNPIVSNNYVIASPFVFSSIFSRHSALCFTESVRRMLDLKQHLHISLNHEQYERINYAASRQ